ncbi:hypothetical protein EVA_04745 [gut metagenome]|uniref:Uncharacterized protein n=1 Tax=gut metagenome TaxID=749906 RepID=J9D3D5_9ZZZZ
MNRRHCVSSQRLLNPFATSTQEQTEKPNAIGPICGETYATDVRV